MVGRGRCRRAVGEEEEEEQGRHGGAPIVPVGADGEAVSCGSQWWAGGGARDESGGSIKGKGRG